MWRRVTAGVWNSIWKSSLIGSTHNVLMAYVQRQVEDKRVLRLSRRYLAAGVMSGGIASRRQEGTPQGGPLSPLLSNILFNELDRELERRGHRFVRYVDDANIYLIMSLSQPLAHAQC
jgi:RNA-directed DNA polymerase